jgi:hypothetical protein
MTISLITLCAAVFFCGLILLNKKREISKGSSFLRIGNARTDSFLSDLSYSIEYTIAKTDTKTLRTLCKSKVALMEGEILKVLHLAGQRFEVLGHAVTGKHIPKNRGSVSFFLKNIEKRDRGGLIK